MSHVSANQATAVGVITQPPIPTVEPSAQASAAAGQWRRLGMDMGRSGDWARVCASELRLSTLSRRKRVCVASGFEALMNWVLAEAGTSGRSALQWSLWPRYPRILDPGQM